MGLDPDEVDNAGPIPWRPAGRLMPAPGKAGEWHELPLDDDAHDFDGCPCEPELHVADKDGQLRSVWVHHRHAGAPH